MDGYCDDPAYQDARTLVLAPYADGTRAIFDWQGQTYERMIPEYGRDGRHLNEAAVPEVGLRSFSVQLD